MEVILSLECPVYNSLCSHQPFYRHVHYTDSFWPVCTTLVGYNHIYGREQVLQVLHCDGNRFVLK